MTAQERSNLRSRVVSRTRKPHLYVEDGLWGLRQPLGQTATQRLRHEYAARWWAYNLGLTRSEIAAEIGGLTE